MAGSDFTFPSSLLNSIQSACSIDADQLKQAHQQETPVSVRLNPLKPTTIFSDYEKVKWCENAFYLPERISFIKDPLFHAGTYYVQEASSMFLESAVKQTVELSEDLNILDLCAAPGGKSTLLNSLISEQSMLVSNEVIKTRVGALAENLSKWGRANVVVSNNDPKDFAGLPDYFDLIVVDAPCSGSGLFRKQNDAIDHWSEDNVTHCSLRQKRILEDILPSLKEEGTLIYSTCSYSAEENEEIVSWLCNTFGLESLRLKLPEDAGITETITHQEIYGYRFFPHLAKGEGFFLSAFRKKSSTNGYISAGKIINEKINASEINSIGEFIHLTAHHEIIKQKEHFFLVNKRISGELATLSSSLSLRKKGTLLGEFKGKDFIPHHELALSVYLKNTVAFIEVGQDIALKFLRKADFKLTEESPKGFCLLRYNGHAIGWIKNLGNRVNNYLPKEWRILSEI